MINENINVLMVDDEKDLLNAVQRRLRTRGFNIITADNGSTALEMTEDHNFDIAIIDQKMPGMSGKELLSALKKKLPKIKIIIMSGHDFESDDEELKSQIDAVLSKPCEFDDLLSVIKKLYANQQ